MRWAVILLLLLAGCGRPTSPPVDDHFALIRGAQRASGAIAMTPGGAAINPYFANQAARALTLESGNLSYVQRYMDWYIAHLNDDGTIYDYRVVDGQEVSTKSYDSADSYAATFLSLVAAGGDEDWVLANRAALDRVAGAIIAVTDTDGLTWAKAEYPYKLLMDNCEVYEGWSEWAGLLDRLGDGAGAAAARERALAVERGLARFDQGRGLWAWALSQQGDQSVSDPANFYPDAVAQLFPLITGLTDDDAGYRLFARAQPGWSELTAGDFPWLLPAYAAARAGDEAAAARALGAVSVKYPSLDWPWYVAESAWVIETANHRR